MFSIFVLCGIICLFVECLKVLFTALFSPLSAFPNAHFSVPFSSIWLLLIKAREREQRTRSALHRSLGPVIRIGPRELSINDVNGVKTVYGGGFEKNSWYDGFSNYGLPFLFVMKESKQHADRKRMLNHVYSNTYIQTSPELDEILQTFTNDLVSQIKTYAREDTEIDTYKLTKSFAMDCTSANLFGLENGTRFMEDAMAGGQPLKIFETGLSHLFWQLELPRVVDLFKRVGFHLVPKDVFDAWQSVEQLCFQKCAIAKQSLLQNGTKDVQDRRSYPIVYAQLYRKLQEVETNPEKLDKLVAAEMLDHMLAGNEGPGVTLTYLMWELSTHPKIRQRLQEEINDSKKSTGQSLLISTKVCNALPVLDAVLQETMRLYPAGFGPFPRIVPQKGANIGNVDIPPGTLVSATAYALHRNPSVFPDPDEWRPERWLEANAEARKEMQRWFWVFGSGGRMCIGNHFAIRVMKTFIAAVYADFTTSNIGEKPEQLETIMGTPVRNRVFMKFHARAGE